MSRINVKMKSDNETEINGIGPQITESDVEKLFEKLEKLENGDILVLSGSIPKSIDDRIYETIMSRLDGKGIRIVVDATKDLLLNVLKYHPFLIKPNNHELGEMFGAELKSDEDIITYAGKSQEMGAVNVLVSMAGDGAILVTEEKEVHKMGVAKGTVKNLGRSRRFDGGRIHCRISRQTGLRLCSEAGNGIRKRNRIFGGNSDKKRYY